MNLKQLLKKVPGCAGLFRAETKRSSFCYQSRDSNYRGFDRAVPTFVVASRRLYSQRSALYLTRSPSRAFSFSTPWHSYAQALPAWRVDLINAVSRIERSFNDRIFAATIALAPLLMWREA